MSGQAAAANTELDEANIAQFQQTGRYRPVNFFKPPFNLPEPVCIAKDTEEKGMFIMLYDLKHIANFSE